MTIKVSIRVPTTWTSWSARRSSSWRILSCRETNLLDTPHARLLKLSSQFSDLFLPSSHSSTTHIGTHSTAAILIHTHDLQLLTLTKSNHHDQRSIHSSQASLRLRCTYPNPITAPHKLTTSSGAGTSHLRPNHGATPQQAPPSLRDEPQQSHRDLQRQPLAKPH